MRDFTLRTYESLLSAFALAGYTAVSFAEYCKIKQSSEKALPERFVILRHDVDKRPHYSVKMAEVEHAHGMIGSYYFRIVPESNDAAAIGRIVVLGHEVGYHYEDMALCGGDSVKAYAHFEESLRYFRQYYPVETCCMHGSPLSKYDNRALWQTADYHTFGLIGEPYYDVDFGSVFYLTDTGRCWDGYRYSVRDKVPAYQQKWIASGLTYHSTAAIVSAMQEGTFPAKVMLTIHPQRWSDSMIAWGRELVVQNMKNCVKQMIVGR